MESQAWHPPGSSLALLGKVQKGDNGLSLTFGLGESCPRQLQPSCQTLQFLLVCHCCLSNCYTSAGAQREWVGVNPCVGSLRGTAWDSRSFFYQLNFCWFCSQRLWWFFSWHWNPGLEVWCGAGNPHSQDIPPEFFSSNNVNVGPAHSTSLPLLPVWMDVVSLIS